MEIRLLRGSLIGSSPNKKVKTLKSEKSVQFWNPRDWKLVIMEIATEIRVLRGNLIGSGPNEKTIWRWRSMPNRENEPYKNSKNSKHDKKNYEKSSMKS